MAKTKKPKVRLYNTLTRKKEIFKPLKSPVRMYTCGPTVYDYVHIGNLRTYIFEDILRRTLEMAGFRVRHVMNITDVGHLTSDADTGEDKMEVGAQREKKTVWDIAFFYTQAFMQDIERLRIKKPSVICKATDHIMEMISLVRALEKKGYTYRTDDGIYYDTSRFKAYGKLARLKKEGLKAGARVEVVPGKRNPTDFALWKFSKKKRQMEWDSPWGRGFPGWHIECSAMAMKYLETLDIHCGGVDHIAVHHTNEIAQSEAATGKKFVNFWVHGEFMLVDGRKMAKSLGNFYRLQNMLDRGIGPLAFRYLCASSHYRKQLNFTFQSLEHAEKTIESINDFFQRLSSAKLKKDGKTLEKMKRLALGFDKCLFDDLNTPHALSALFSVVHLSNKLMDSGKMDRETLGFVKNFVLRADGIFCFLREKEGLTEEEKKLIEEREAARSRKDFALADEIRERLKGMGMAVEDTPEGPRWKKNKSRI